MGEWKYWRGKGKKKCLIKFQNNVDEMYLVETLNKKSVNKLKIFNKYKIFKIYFDFFKWKII